jgi:hypothetical protein
LIWAASITFAHFGISVAMRAANSSGVLAIASKPSAVSRSAVSGCYIALAHHRIV